jgi:PAS domain S-box-containing protein
MVQGLSTGPGKAWTIRAHADGASALAAARGAPPDLILADDQTTGIDSLELLRELRAHPETFALPVVLISSCTKEEKKLEALQEGADDYLVKPVPVCELTAKISSRIRLSRMRSKSHRELREISNRLKAAIDATGGAIYDHRVPLDGSMYHDERWAEIIGYDSTELPEHDRFLEWLLDHIHPDDRARLDRAYADFVSGKVPNYRVEVRLRHKTGRWIWVEGYAHAVDRDESGKARRVVGMMTDVTERKKVEETLNKLNATLEQKISERTKLAEARALQLQHLAVELSEAEERERSRISDLLHDDLQQILASAHLRLQAAGAEGPLAATLETIDGLIKESIAKARRLSHELSPAILNNSDLTESLRWLASHMKEHFDLEVGIEDETGEAIPDPIKRFLFRACHEFLFNIVKHAGTDTARIRLTPSGPHFILRVEDEGSGFDPGELERCPRPPGFGLLSIKERVCYMGGELEVRAAPGEGSVFVLKIPLHLLKQDAPRRLEKTGKMKEGMPKTPCTRKEADGLRILFADDHKVLRQGLIELVEDQPGIHVVGEAENGRQALDLARELRPDGIVMDVSMPVMNGIEATRRIKAEMPEIRIIGLSMHEEAHVSRMLRLAGADALISKSASAAELLEAICTIAEKG